MLFFDVVQSTALASELGDKRWAELLVRMRRTVARELRRGGGREQDFSGDGFLAVFSEPAQAIRAAGSIIAALHELGLDVRSGVHAGECEVVDGKMRGIAVHIGARVMALAGPAEVMATGTVRELVVGSGIRFEEVGVHELKGVEGTWLVYRAVDVDGHPLEPPLGPEAASAAIAALELGRRRRRVVRSGIAAVLVAVAAAATISLLALRGGTSLRYGTNSVIRIDPVSGRVLDVVADPNAVPDRATYVFTSRGTLWDWDNNYGFERRDMQTGRVLATSPRHAPAWCPYILGWDIALGTIWLDCSSDLRGTPPLWLARADELSFRHLATVRLPAGFTLGSGGSGLGAYWVVDEAGQLVRVDALTNRTTTYSVPVSTLGSCSTPPWYPGVVGPAVSGRTLWFAQCEPNELLGFDTSTGRTTTLAVPQAVAWLLVVPAVPERLWLFDPYGGTITPFSTAMREMGEPTALPGTPQSTTVTNDAIWVAAGDVVDRVAASPTLGPQLVTTIPMPKGVWASTIAVDPSTRTLWVTNNTYAKSNPQWAGP